MKALLHPSRTALLAIGFGLVLNPVEAENTETKAGSASVAPLYTVDKYDPQRNPESDLKATVEKAKADGKRILIQVGGDWCGWCHRMNKYLHENEKVAGALAQDFVVMKVNFSRENENKEFLKRFPSPEGYPHLYVLETDGTFLHSQGTSALEEGNGYSEKAVLEFLARWAPKPPGR